MLGDGFFTEVKTENALDRVTSEANPRPLERVPAGSAFDFTLILDAYLPEDRELLRDLFAAMRLLEQSALGGSGARGSGQIRFEGLKLTWRDLDYYRQGTAEQVIDLLGDTLESVVQQYGEIQWKP
jgi:CRISPR-associated protein Csm3